MNTPSSPQSDFDASNESRGMTGSCGMSSSQASEGSAITDRAMQSVRQSSQRLAREVQDKAMNAIDTQRERATQSLDRVAQAIRSTADDLDADDETVVADLAQRAATGVGRVSNYLRERDLTAVLHDAERVARVHPAICLGSAFLVGAIAGRVLRASRRHEDSAAGQAAPAQPLGVYRSQSEYAPSKSASSYGAVQRSTSSMDVQSRAEGVTG